MIQAQPLPEACTFDIHRIERSIWALAGASGQLLKRVTPGCNSSARKAAVSLGTGARKIRRLVARIGNFPVSRMGPDPLMNCPIKLRDPADMPKSTKTTPAGIERRGTPG